MSNTIGTNEPKKIYICGASRLPAEYQEVEYIENTSTSYINTGLLAKSGYKIDLKFYTSSSNNSDQTVIGAVPSSVDCLYYGINYGYNNGIYWNYNNGWHDIFNKMYVGNVYEATSIIRNGHQEVILDGVSVQSNTASCNQAGGSNMTIFARGGSSNYALIKLYSMQIYDNDDTKLRDFVPCYRKLDSVIGLYDLVSDVFYTNAGGGTFSKGANIGGEKEIKRITIRPNGVEKLIRPTWLPKWRIDEGTQGWYYSLGTGTMGGYMTEDGAYYFSANEVGNTITRYTLATPYVLSGYTATQQKTGLSTCHQVCFKPDGTKMFVACYGSNNIRVFNLSTAWDLSTATETTAFSISRPTACFITENGSHLYSSRNNNDILHYTLSTPFDTTTATLSDSAASPSGAGCRGISISPDGKHLFIVDTGNYRIIQTELTTPYVVSTFASDTKYYLPQTQIGSGVMVMGNVSSSGKYLFYSNSRQYVVRIDMTGV